MLLDIEMPRMDGFELATTIRNDARMKALPIIMITSRTGQKHTGGLDKSASTAISGSLITKANCWTTSMPC